MVLLSRARTATFFSDFTACTASFKKTKMSALAVSNTMFIALDVESMAGEQSSWKLVGNQHSWYIHWSNLLSPFQSSHTSIQPIHVFHLRRCAWRDWRIRSKLHQWKYSCPNLSVGFYRVPQNCGEERHIINITVGCIVFPYFWEPVQKMLRSSANHWNRSFWHRPIRAVIHSAWVGILSCTFK